MQRIELQKQHVTVRIYKSTPMNSVCRDIRQPHLMETAKTKAAQTLSLRAAWSQNPNLLAKPVSRLEGCDHSRR